MGGIRHRDWDVSQAHADKIKETWPSGVKMKRPVVRKNIPGVIGTRLGEGLRSGLWIKPLGSVPGKTFSCVRDVGRRSLLIVAQGTSTEQSDGPTGYEIVRDLVRELFHDRRVTGLDGEMYSRVDVRDYDIDDRLARKLDVDVMEITTWFREDRTHSA